MWWTSSIPLYRDRELVSVLKENPQYVDSSDAAFSKYNTVSEPSSYANNTCESLQLHVNTLLKFKWPPTGCTSEIYSTMYSINKSFQIYWWEK